MQIIKKGFILFVTIIICMALFCACNGSGTTDTTKDTTNDTAKDTTADLGYTLSEDGKTLLTYAPKETAASFTVPEGVETVVANAFSNVHGLKELTFSSTVKTIKGPFDFLMCEKIVIPETVESVALAFYNCPNLKEIVCAAPITEFSTATNCPALESLVLPDTVTEFGVWAFDLTPALKEIRIYGRELVRDEAFESLCGGNVIYLPEGLTKLNAEQLLGLSEDYGLYFPDSLETLDIIGFGSWSHPARTLSVAADTEVTRGDRDYHNVTVRDSSK